MGLPTTGTEAAMLLDEGGGLRRMVEIAVARALMNQEGHWRTDDKRDAEAVAEVACYMFLGEMKAAFASMDRMRQFIRDSDTRPKAGDAKQGSTRE